jgi:hypothetical protein
MEFVRVEVRLVEEEAEPPIVLPRSGGHRRVYTFQMFGVWYLINVMAIGDTSDGVTFGKADLAMSLETPEKYFAELSPMFISIAQQRWDRDCGTFIAVINPEGPVLADILEPQTEIDFREPLL